MTDVKPPGSTLSGSAHIEPVALDALAEVEGVISVARQASGYVPTSMRIMAHKPDILRAFGGLIGAIILSVVAMQQDNSLLTATTVIYGTGLVVMLSASALYNVTRPSRRKALFQRLDQMGEAQAFIEVVEREVGVPVRVVGVGAERDDYLMWVS